MLTASAAAFSNRSLAANRNSALLLRLIGGNANVVFDESHLGVQETGSVLGLVHRYHLDGMLWGLLAVALVFIWGNAVGFPPPAPASVRAVSTLGHDSRLGLAQLLRRQIPLARVIGVCLSEWQRINTCTRLPARPIEPDPARSLPASPTGTHSQMTEQLDRFKHNLDRARAEIRKVILGQDHVIDQALIVILTRQHALIEGVPGIAKTLLVRVFARITGEAFSRIQFTPDLMPADITGTSVFNLQRNEFNFIPGPVFTTFLLADEINRAPARTQSALLQAMQERTVTIDRETHRLSPGFTVFATQNPIEYEGTYPLPEAQKDRFMMKIVMSFPERDEEISLATRMLGAEAPEALFERGVVEPVLAAGELDRMRDALADVAAREELVRYAVDIVRTTREHQSILVGAGPRATQSLLLASRAAAALEGRDFVTPDDVRSMAFGVLDHRIVLRPESEIEGVRTQEVLDAIFREIPVPR